MTTQAWLSYYNIKVRVNFWEILPKEFTWEILESETNNYNNSLIINELPIHLNPNCLDINKVKALLEKLIICPFELVNHLRNQVIYLRNPHLYLGFGLPFDAQAIKEKGVIYWQENEPEPLFKLGLKIEFVIELAQKLAEEAQIKYQDAEKKLAELEQEISHTEESPQLGIILRQKSLWNQIKFNLATIWQNNCQIIADNQPNMEHFNALKTAQSAWEASIVTPSTGMPEF
jgi:hypothetical protein